MRKLLDGNVVRERFLFFLVIESNCCFDWLSWNLFPAMLLSKKYLHGNAAL